MQSLSFGRKNQPIMKIQKEFINATKSTQYYSNPYSSSNKPTIIDEAFHILSLIQIFNSSGTAITYYLKKKKN